MSLGAFLALCIVGMDFLIYCLFQWVYGEKRAVIAKKVAAQRRATALEGGKPFLAHSNKAGPVTQRRIRKIRARIGMVEGQRRWAQPRPAFASQT